MPTAVDVAKLSPPPTAQFLADPAFNVDPLTAYVLDECSVPSTASASTAQDLALPAPEVSVTPVPPIAQALDEYCELSTAPSILFE